MKRFLSSVCCALALWLAMVVGVSQAQAQNLTVKFTFTDASVQEVKGQSTLADAFFGIDLTRVQELEISKGTVVADDWTTMKNSKSNLTALEKFVITDDVTSVADISSGIFNNALQEITVAKVEKLLGESLRDLSNLKTAVFPDVTEVRNFAFRGSSIEQIYLPSVITIGHGAFDQCKELTLVDFPQATLIDSMAFMGCSKLVNVNLPEVLRLKGDAFKNCSELVVIDLPKVERIGRYAFLNCQKLEIVKLPMVKTLEQHVFYGLQSLNTIELNTLESVKVERPIEKCHAIKQIVFPELIEAGGYLISECNGIETVIVPKVKTLRSIPFHTCATLSEIRMGSVPPTLTHPTVASCISLLFVRLFLSPRMELRLLELIIVRLSPNIKAMLVGMIQRKNGTAGA